MRAKFQHELPHFLLGSLARGLKAAVDVCPLAQRNPEPVPPWRDSRQGFPIGVSRFMSVL